METSVEGVDTRQNELVQLQKEYRHMELNRRAYAEESQSLLRKQQSTINKLRKDNDSLKSEIALIMRTSNKPLTALQQETVQKLHEQGEKYVEAIEFEKRSLEAMDEQVNILKQKVLHQRRAMGGVNASKENQYMIEKQIRILENRLEKASIKFNEAICENKVLRDKIDDLRRERVVFENVYRKMERELQEKKKKMAEIIELSNQSYEQRDTYQMEVAAIEQANRKEQEDFEEQMVELGRLLETELALPNPSNQSRLFMNTSGSKSRLGVTEKSGFVNGIRSAPGTASSTHDLASMERVQNFEEAFNKIKGATGITDIDELVKTFIKNEDHNFSLFNYVNEQNNEIEKCEEQIQVLRDEERKYAQENGDDANQHKQILKELESKLSSTESMAEKYELRCQDMQRTLESLKRGIQGLVDKLEMEEDEAFSDANVSESNIVHFLGLIEQKSNDLLEKYALAKEYLLNGGGSNNNTHTANSNSSSSSSNANGLTSSALVAGESALSPARSMASVLGTGPRVPAGHDNLQINPPKLDDYQSDEDEDDDDDDTRPFTREELKARTLNRLQRRGPGGAGKSPKKKGGKLGR